MTFLQACLLFFWMGGSVATALSITVVSKLGGNFKAWEMIVGSFFWPLVTYFAWRDYRRMTAEIDQRFKADIENLPMHVHVDPEGLCPACRASFDAVLQRMTECRTCTPLSRNTETEH